MYQNPFDVHVKILERAQKQQKKNLFESHITKDEIEMEQQQWKKKSTTKIETSVCNQTHTDDVAIVCVGISSGAEATVNRINHQKNPSSIALY